jgi:hypothetical protein
MMHNLMTTYPPQEQCQFQSLHPPTIVAVRHPSLNDFEIEILCLNQPYGRFTHETITLLI